MDKLKFFNCLQESIIYNKFAPGAVLCKHLHPRRARDIFALLLFCAPVFPLVAIMCTAPCGNKGTNW